MTDHKSHDPNGVADKDLACLNADLPGTQAHQDESLLISVLNALCRRYGYGRVPGLAKEIEEVWRDPEKAEYFKNRQEERFEMLLESRRALLKRLRT